MRPSFFHNSFQRFSPSGAAVIVVAVSTNRTNMENVSYVEFPISQKAYTRRWPELSEIDIQNRRITPTDGAFVAILWSSDEM